MMTPNPRSLGDNFPDDPRFLQGHDDESHSDMPQNDAPQTDAPQSSEADQEFQNPMTEEDTASGGPADPPGE